ncbi:hypothetical protein DPX16_4962 [Anabarilius grahami]|uniref:Uncharacterized protein n=1 Tax=Anabarilius grahami TaxID=495550 RepID=A0A3N0XU08_ANAGA|nr:hypothetical protein DPX16_4962 [Anabarilius grahami]
MPTEVSDPEPPVSPVSPYSFQRHSVPLQSTFSISLSLSLPLTTLPASSPVVTMTTAALHHSWTVAVDTHSLSHSLRSRQSPLSPVLSKGFSRLRERRVDSSRGNIRWCVSGRWAVARVDELAIVETLAGAVRVRGRRGRTDLHPPASPMRDLG